MQAPTPLPFFFFCEIAVILNGTWICLHLLALWLLLFYQIDQIKIYMSPVFSEAFTTKNTKNQFNIFTSAVVCILFYLMGSVKLVSHLILSAYITACISGHNLKMTVIKKIAGAQLLIEHSNTEVWEKIVTRIVRKLMAY